MPSLEGAPSGPGDFSETAAWAAGRVFAEHLDESDAERIAREVLSFPLPLVEVEPGLFVLELFHGPTLAFKDVGARFMAGLMRKFSRADETDITTILVATSGDTGGAVASAFHGWDGARVVVLFPRDGISPRQRRQMSTLGGNVAALAVRGTFDDCQRLTKEAFASEEMREAHHLTSANSINVGRLLPQMFYYAHAFRLLDGASPRFVVPSGNLGNLCAGLLAHMSGIPAAGFLAATNTNDAFVQFLATDKAVDRASIPTISNAMDVGRPSNLERVRWLYRDEPTRLRQLVHGATVTDEDTRRCIAEVYGRTGYILDPHSAVAYTVAERHHDRGSGPAVVLATAHPAKFPDTVEAAIGRDVEVPDSLRRVMDGPERFSEIEPTLAALEGHLAAESAA
jgi:threonine synthase